MRNTPNYPNRADKELNAIRTMVAGLPKGQRHAILNRCDKLAVLYRRQQADESRPTPAQEHDAIVGRHSAALEVISALLAGRVLSFKNEDEFPTSQFHTTIVLARRILARKHPDLRLASKWTSDGDGSRPYKLYWIETL